MIQLVYLLNDVPLHKMR